MENLSYIQTSFKNKLVNNKKHVYPTKTTNTKKNMLYTKFRVKTKPVWCM